MALDVAQRRLVLDDEHHALVACQGAGRRVCEGGGALRGEVRRHVGRLPGVRVTAVSVDASDTPGTVSGAVAASSRRVTRPPPDGLFSAVIDPPASVTKRCASARPRPVPLPTGFVE